MKQSVGESPLLPWAGRGAVVGVCEIPQIPGFISWAQDDGAAFEDGGNFRKRGLGRVGGSPRPSFRGPYPAPTLSLLLTLASVS